MEKLSVRLGAANCYSALDISVHHNTRIWQGDNTAVAASPRLEVFCSQRKHLPSPSSKRSGNVDEEECVSGKRFITTLDFYRYVNHVFRLGFLTSFGDHVLTTIMAEEFFIGAESPDRGQRIFGKFSSSNLSTPMSR